MTSPAETPILTKAKKGEGKSVLYKGRFLLSPYDPVRRAKDKVLSTPILENTLYIIPSPLLGYGIPALLERLPDSSSLLLMECDPVLNNLSLKEAILPEGSRIIRTFVQNSADLLPILQKITPLPRRCMLVDISAGYNLNRDFYNALVVLAEKGLNSYWKNRLTVIHLGKLWFRNLFINIARLHKNISFSLPQTEKSIVIAGAGPSLEKNLDFLRKKREKFYLLSVDTALSSLCKWEILPDAVLNLDAQHLNLQDFYPVKGVKTDMIADLTAPPSSVDLLGGKRIFTAVSFTETRLFNDLTRFNLLPLLFPPLGSVAISALRIAQIISSSPIIMTGIDFAYFNHDIWHCRGVVHHTRLLEGSNRFSPPHLFGNSMKKISLKEESDKGRLFTDRQLLGYAEIMKEELSSLNRTVYTLPGGLPLGLPNALEESDQYLFVKSTAPRTAFPKQPLRSDVKRFLNNQKINLESVINGWEIYMKTEDMRPMDKALKSCDYLTIPYPDPKGAGFAEIQYLNRAALDARSYYALITSLCENL